MLKQLCFMDRCAVDSFKMRQCFKGSILMQILADLDPNFMEKGQGCHIPAGSRSIATDGVFPCSMEDE